MENPAIGKILGMLMAYGVSFLGLLLAYYNYKKRVVNAAPKTESQENPKAAEPVKNVAPAEPAKPLASKSSLALIIPASAAVVISLIAWAASVSGDKGSAMANITDLLPGMIVPAVVFSISFYLTWLLYKHFAGHTGTGEGQ